jgi:hypothetical protein
VYDRPGVTRVLLALADVGLGIPTQEGLERLGRDVRWSAAHAAGPDPGLTPLPDVVVVDADGDGGAGGGGRGVARARSAARDPGSADRRRRGPRHRVPDPLCSPGATAAELAAAIDAAARMRLAAACRRAGAARARPAADAPAPMVTAAGAPSTSSWRARRCAGTPTATPPRPTWSPSCGRRGR